MKIYAVIAAFSADLGFDIESGSMRNPTPPELIGCVLLQIHQAQTLAIELDVWRKVDAVVDNITLDLESFLRFGYTSEARA